MDLREVQTELKARGLYSRGIDGDYGPRTDDAVEAFLANQRVQGFSSWPDSRQLIAVKQALCRLRDIEVGEIDGRMGTMTRHAFEVYDARKANGWQKVAAVENWRGDTDEKTPAVIPSHPLPAPSVAGLKPPAHGPWPKQSRVPQFFGDVGTHQATLRFPFPMRLAWETDTVAKTASCHEKCKESFEFIWESTLNHYGIDEIKRLRLDLYGGLLNVRKMRGGSSWSMHSWGIAEDVDPDRNQLKFTRKQATLDDAPYDPFWSFVYAAGAIGLGRERDYDWMHFQFALL